MLDVLLDKTLLVHSSSLFDHLMFDSSLNMAEVFLTFVFQHFCEEHDLRIVHVNSAAGDDHGSPFDDERFESVLVTEISVHELF